MGDPVPPGRPGHSDRQRTTACAPEGGVGRATARLTKTVSLDMGSSKGLGMDVTSNDQLVRCEFPSDPGRAVGKDAMTVPSSDGATATLPSAFEVPP